MYGNITSQKIASPQPPEKGIFPLDHLEECKEEVLKYTKCLNLNHYKSAFCRNETKNYLGCRMKKGLMAKEDFSKLGLSEQEDKEFIEAHLKFSQKSK